MRSRVILGAVLLFSILTVTRTYKVASENDFKFSEEDLTDLLVEEKELIELEEELEEQARETENRKKIQQEFLRYEEEAKRGENPNFHNEYYDDETAWMNDDAYVNDEGDYDGSGGSGGSGDFCIDEVLLPCVDPKSTFCESQRCDGVRNCPDGDDEEGCGCLKTQFQCDGNKCISKDKLCDDREDCTDGTDENDCDNGNSCPEGELNSCVNPKYTFCKSQRCDGVSDCPDADDEEGCEIGCSPSEFQCNNTKCIPMEKRCDKNADCGDKTDEEGCDCKKSEFRCDGVCLPLEKKCDKIDDCSDGTDEEDCDCNKNQFQCDKKCISMEKKCDGKRNCNDQTDEKNCECVYMGKGYNLNDQLPDTCAELICDKGKWITTGNINKDCYECTLYNDPHIKTYEKLNYDWHGHCNYSITQEGKTKAPSYALYGKFDQCLAGISTPTCLGEFVYKDSDTLAINFGAKMSEMQKGINLFYVSVNGAMRQVVSSKFATSLNTINSEQDILAWRVDDCLRILGTRGIMIHYCGWGIHIWAHPTIKRSLHGLCGKISTFGSDGLVGRDGRQYEEPFISWPNNQIDKEFAMSWMAVDQPDSCTRSTHRSKRQAQDPACKASEAELKKYKTDCSNKIQNDIPSEQRKLLIDDCAFDRCVITEAKNRNPSANYPDPDEWLNQANKRAKRQADIMKNTTDISATTTATSSTPAKTTLDPSVPPNGCGGKLEGVKGEIIFPVNGKKYDNSADCSWIISTPTGTTIEISFKAFKTEKCCDYLSVWDGNNTGAPMIGKYSGYLLPESLNSKNNHLYIHFMSDKDNADEGFNLTWEIKGCFEEFEGSSGEITFPADGQSYGHNRTCTWSIKSLPNTFIKINFITFNTEENYDILSIWDGKNYNSQLLESFSGKTIPKELNSSSNYVYLQFTSDEHGSGTGFSLSWQQIRKKECEYAGKKYLDGLQLPDVCAALICKHGKWYPTGNIHQDCSECTLYNDPHIKTYENLNYDWHGHCNYSITQQGMSQTPSFALYGKFDQCLHGISNPTCLGEFVYQESDTLSISFGSPMAKSQKEDDIFYITVNGFSQLVDTSSFALGLQVGEFEQDVLTWRAGGCLRILGTRGLMIHYCGWGIHVWAHPKISNNIFGLCGIHRGAGTVPSRRLSSLVDRNGTQYDDSISVWPNNVIDRGFADSWKTQFQSSSCTNTRRRKREVENSGCPLASGSPELKKYKTACSKKVGQDLTVEQQQRIIDDCAFDRCVIMTAKDNNPSADYPDPDDWLNQAGNRYKRQAEINKNTTDITANITTVTTPEPTDPEIVHPCGSKLSDSQGELKYPVGSETYLNNDMCEWTISSPEGINITLTFDKFDTQLDKDFLYIWDGASDKSELRAKLSGNFKIPKLTSSSNYLSLRFTSDSSMAATGFKIKWKANNGDCLYNGTLYKQDDDLPGMCAGLVCKGGKWHPTGQINSQCSECTVYNDPHFKTFENVRYDWHGHCNYSITQKGKSMLPEFALYGKFDECLINIPNPTCLGELVYKDAEDVFVEFGAAFIKIQYGRSLFHVIVNGQKQKITSSSVAELLNGTTHSILAWKENGCLKIVGTQGLTIQYCGWGLHVWAHSDLQNEIFGLCGRYSNNTESKSPTVMHKSSYGLIARNGIYYSQPVTAWPNNQVDDEFALSWETQEQLATCPSNRYRLRRHKRQIKESACKANKAKLLKYKEDCGTKVSKDLQDKQREAIIEDCAFDRCVLLSEMDKNNSSSLPDPEVWLNETANRAQRQLHINENLGNITDATVLPCTQPPATAPTTKKTTINPDATVPPGTKPPATAPITMKTTEKPDTACGSNRWQCKNKQCIAINKRCNHVYDCDDNSDETGCKATSAISQPATSTPLITTKPPATTKASTIAKTSTTMKTSVKPGCGFGMWRCNDGECIKLKRKCDKNYDCKDKSDESQCTSCGFGMWRCNDGECIKLKKRCDKSYDCKDKSDETQCTSCGEGRWQCTDKACIDAKKRCDRQYDCLDYSDEKNCNVCEIGQWQCTEGSCIEEFQRCDGVYDCFDHTDEVDCQEEESANVFVCHDGTRLFWWQRCDRIIDCPDYSDEFNCQPDYYWNYWG